MAGDIFSQSRVLSEWLAEKALPLWREKGVDGAGGFVLLESGTYLGGKFREGVGSASG